MYTVTDTAPYTVPEITGLLMFVIDPATGDTIIGTVGTAVSIVISVTALKGEIFVATSVAVAVIEWVPSKRTLLLKNVNVLVAATVVPTTTLSI
jgi:hypothetical protein